jgi:hypothetical protein
MPHLLEASTGLTLARTELVGKLLDQLTRDEGIGWILEGDNRIISFRSDTFQTLSDQLVTLVGSKIAAVILNQLGMAAGRVVMNYSRGEIRSQNDLATVLDSTIRARGWGRCVDFTWHSSGTRTTYMIKLKGSALSRERHLSQPSCHLLRGAISGWLEAYSNSKVFDSIERECETMGKPFCVFEIVLEKPYEGAHAVG